jgi:Tetratricopeptide repeat
VALPQGWNAAAQQHWSAGARQPAIDAVLAQINAAGPRKPVALVLQLAYYLFLCGDPAAAAQVLTTARGTHPRHPELLQNLAVCLSRAGRPAEAIAAWQDFLAVAPETPLAHDGLAACHYALGRFEAAAASGARSLVLKDALHGRAPRGWRLPAGTPQAFAGAPGKRDVIAFSLWGEQPRYLRGALDNALAVPALYPGWQMRCHVDATVPAELRAALAGLGVDVRLEPPGQSLRRRLCWRFGVANDPSVGRFLVRDIDSLVGPRERAAVDAWIASDRWFHVLRDWWVHTDLVLAGLWGGVAGVLPDLAALLARYAPSHMETPNIDQWFLRDELWGCIRQGVLVHDRCFAVPGALPWPQPAPPGNEHVGQDVFSARRAQQEERLRDWLPRLRCLQVPPA